MKTNYLLILGLLSKSLIAQVGINTIPHETAILDMSESKKGLLLTGLELTSPLSSHPVKEVKNGVIVHNSTANNSLKETYYYWNDEKWEPLFRDETEVFLYESEGIHASTLGYNPYGEGSHAPKEFTFDHITATRKNECVKFKDTYANAIEHTYCGYKLSEDIDWEKAYTISKSLRGYLAVITTNSEWNFIKDKFITSKEANKSNVWIGYNKITEPGNVPEYSWITGERSIINWSNNSTLEGNHAPYDRDAPIDLNAIDNCGYITNSLNESWKKERCDKKVNFNYIIVEFQK